MQAVLEAVATANNPFCSLDCENIVNVFSGVVAPRMICMLTENRNFCSS